MVTQNKSGRPRLFYRTEKEDTSYAPVEALLGGTVHCWSREESVVGFSVGARTAKKKSRDLGAQQEPPGRGVLRVCSISETRHLSEKTEVGRL